MNKLLIVSMIVLLSALLAVPAAFAGQNEGLSPASFFYGYTINNANAPSEGTVKSMSAEKTNPAANFEALSPANFYGYGNSAVGVRGETASNVGLTENNGEYCALDNAVTQGCFYGYGYPERNTRH